MKIWSEFLESLPDKKKADLLQYMNLIGLKDGDAIFPLLVSLEQYKTFLEDFPADLDKQVTATIAKVTAGATEKAHADLASAVSDTAIEIASRTTSSNRAMWFSIASVVALVLLFGGFFVGQKYAYSDVEIKKHELSGAAAWAASDTGKFYKEAFDVGFQTWSLKFVKDNRDSLISLLKWTTSKEGMEAWKKSGK